MVPIINNNRNKMIFKVINFHITLYRFFPFGALKLTQKKSKVLYVYF